MSSRALQKYYYERYGTTLRGLMEEHRISAEAYLDFTHDIDRTGLCPTIRWHPRSPRFPAETDLDRGSRDHCSAHRQRP